MRIGIISLFVEMFSIITDYGVIGKAIKSGRICIKLWNPRDFTDDKHRTIDMRPYGGGPGMLMMPQPLKHAIRAAKLNLYNETDQIKVIYLSPQGKKINQDIINELISYKYLILVCGRYRGIDERIIQSEIDDELSIGDYVVSGGELPAMVLIDSIVRAIPGILQTYDSVKNDSFFNGLVDPPQYTRPYVLEDMVVPSILLSGNHAAIKRWRLKQALGYTWLKKPELLRKKILTPEELRLFMEFQKEYNQQHPNKKDYHD